MIADQQRSFHRGGRNLEGLNDEGGAEKREDDGDQQGLKILGKSGLIPSVVATMRICLCGCWCDRLRGYRLLHGDFLGHAVSLSRPPALANDRARDWQPAARLLFL